MSELSPEHQRRMDDLFADHQRKLAQIRVLGHKRIAWSVVVSGALGLLIVFAPDPIGWVISALFAGYAVMALWSIRPGRCVICQRRTSIAVPRVSPLVLRPWWNPLPHPRKDSVFVCSDHFMPYITARVRRNMERD